MKKPVAGTQEALKDWMNGLEKKMKENPEKLAGMNATYQVDFSADGNGKWYIVIADGKPKVAEGEIGVYDNKISMKGADFLSMISGKLKAAVAFMLGKIKITGNIMKLAAISGYLKER